MLRIRGWFWDWPCSKYWGDDCEADALACVRAFCVFYGEDLGGTDPNSFSFHLSNIMVHHIFELSKVGHEDRLRSGRSMELSVQTRREHHWLMGGPKSFQQLKIAERKVALS